MTREFKKIGQKSWIFIFLALLGVYLAHFSCASVEHAYHKNVMRGSIVEVENDKIYLCIGTSDGAKVGQELKVYQIKTMRSEGKVSHRFRREKVGVIRITEIVDEHFANATVISGEANLNNIVELENVK